MKARGTADATTELDRGAVESWMRRNMEDHRDGCCGDVNMTTLAEAAAEHFGANDIGGPLDDPDHWIWEVAADLA